MKKKETINVQGTKISVMRVNNEDYICISDMVKVKDSNFFIANWLRNRNTLEYIGIWEQVHNPDFNCVEFDIIKGNSGLNRFRVSVKDLVQTTNLICLRSTSGRYGGTYAHKDIAFEFAMWISPEFKIYIVKEFQRLKENEQKALGWSAKQWRDSNPDKEGNMRDYASINELICLSNMENLNAVFINDGLSQRERLIKLNQIAIQQMKILVDTENRKLLN